MANIWTLKNKFQRWLDVEIAACEAQSEMGRIPAAALQVIKSRAAFDVQRIDEIEKTTQHDVIAFLTSVAEKVGPEARFIHLGLTSSDVVDTAFSLVCMQATDLVLEEIDRLCAVLKKRALEFKSTPCMGRTHGVHAEPMTFGMKLALAYAEMGRSRQRLLDARQSIAVGKLSGAVGTYSNMDPEVENAVCRKLGLQILPISTQIIQRDRHAQLISALAILAGSLERLATEVRGLQKTECGEVEEPFGAGQKGSSAMPHKKNPIICERITGLARVLRGYALAAFENQSLWHERDISHSSTERVIFPDAFTSIDYMLAKMTWVIEGLVVYPQRMLENIDALGGLVFSGRLLVTLAEAGMTRDEAYAMVQRHAMEARKGGPTFKARVQGDMDIRRKLTPQILSSIFSLQDYIKHAPAIVERAVR